MLKVILVILIIIGLAGHFVPIKTHGIRAVDPNGVVVHRYRLIKGEYDQYSKSGKNIVDMLCTSTCEDISYKFYLW